MFDGVIKIGSVLEVRVAFLAMRHDGRGIQERIADIAVKIRGRTDWRIDVAEVGAKPRSNLEIIPAFAEIDPRHFMRGQHVADVTLADNRRQRKGTIVRRVGRAAADEGWNIIVEQIIGVRRAVRIDALRRQIADDRSDAGLANIEAVGIAAAAVAVLGVEVVGARLRIGVFDLVRRRRSRRAVGILIIERVGVAEHHLVGEGTAHYRLMIVVVKGVFVCQLGQIRHVAFGDVIKAQRDIAFSRRRSNGLPLLPDDTVCSTNGNRSA